MNAGERTFRVAETVAHVETDNGRHRVTVEAVEVDGQHAPQATVFEVSPGGLARVSNRDAEGGPVVLLKPGLKEGGQWTADQAGPGGAAGKATYTALRIDATIEFGMRATKMTNWYAPGVGSVKLEVSAGDWKQTTVLKSFTPGE